VPASRGAMARSAQNYFDLADQQMHKGDYAAARANYKRAWRIEENIAAAKGRQVRARLAMQAEEESIANRR
jgi:Tfp pilus assembly protein PilF